MHAYNNFEHTTTQICMDIIIKHLWSSEFGLT